MKDARSRQYAIAKISAPKLAPVYPRTRLFRLLDQKRKKPVVWISGPAGSGKTTLVAGYLDARKRPCLWYQLDEGDGDIATFFYYMGLAAKKAAPRVRKLLPLLTSEYAFGIPTFTRRFFEELYSRLTSSHGHFLVFDNYQHIPEASPLHEIMQIGLSTIPEGVNVIVISRAEPPATVMGLRAKNRMEIIGWEALRLTQDESRGIVRLDKDRRLSTEAVTAIHEKAGGWAAGLILMAKGAQRREDAAEDVALHRHDEIFDYFATELFDKADEKTRDFLLRSSVLPHMTPALAEKLTGIDHADRILAMLNRRNYFTERRTGPELTYQYHSLFREFLRNRADTHYTADERSHLMRSAAKLLEEAGQVEDAASLLMKAGNWNGLIPLILGSAQSLVAQGRNKTLEEWLTSVPGEILSRNPWLQYWLGACLAPYDSNEAIRYFKKAFALFDGEKNKEGVFLSWAAIVGAIYFSFEDLKRLNGYIGILDELIERYGEIPPGEIDAAVTAGMIVAIIMSGEHPAVDQWQEHALSVIDRVPDGNTRLLCMGQYFYYRVLCGDYEGATRMLRQMNEMMRRCECGILMRLKIKIIGTMLYTYSAQYEECLKIGTEGLSLAEKSGVHALDMILMGMIVWCSITMNVPDTARKFLVRMEASLGNARTWDLTCYYLFSAFEALERKDLGKASQHAREAYALSQKVGAATSNYWCSIFLAVTLEECGDRKSALAKFKEACDHAARWNTPFFTFDYLLSETWFLFRQEKETEGLSSLKKVLKIGREHGFLSSFTWRNSVLGELFARALSEGIEVEYVRGLIRRHNLLPPFDKGGTAGILIDNWPWPIKINSLGRFEILKEGKPVRFSGKVQKKPLEMLKALIAFGGRDVPGEQIAAALWPDADGDAAYKAFGITLIRLRELLGVKDAVHLSEGNVTLDQRYFWIDTWAFEHMLESSEFGVQSSESNAKRQSAIGDRKSEMDLSMREKAINLYKGPFLGAESATWAIPLRERLRDKFLRSVETVGMHREESKEWDKAIGYYKKGLEADDLIEELYRRIILCYRRLGRNAEALSAYNRCKKTLTSYGIELSSETRALLKKD